jgi:hypothetical protein
MPDPVRKDVPVRGTARTVEAGHGAEGEGGSKRKASRDPFPEPERESGKGVGHQSGSILPSPSQPRPGIRRPTPGTQRRIGAAVQARYRRGTMAAC